MAIFRATKIGGYEAVVRDWDRYHGSDRSSCRYVLESAKVIFSEGPLEGKEFEGEDCESEQSVVNRALKVLKEFLKDDVKEE